jgi:hypothetical protein
MKINELLSEFKIWTTNEEKEILKKLKHPTKLSNLSEHDQFKVQAMIRKSLVTKIGHKDPSVVANDKNK